MENKVLIIDFGSSDTRWIARRVRAAKVYCAIVPFNDLPRNLESYKALILSDSSPTIKKQYNPQIDLAQCAEQTTVLAIGNSKEFLINTGERKVVIAYSDELRLSEQHPELLQKFLFDVSEMEQNWTPAAFIKTETAELRQTIKDEKVVLGLSGGVDSTVTAVLLHKAIGEHLHCIFVNNGLLRQNEFTSVLEQYKDMGLNVKGVDASGQFLENLDGVSDPEQKRKIIGRLFIEVFEEEARKIKGVTYLGQGTIYPDVIESVSIDGSVAVKSHHNVGGLPEKMQLKIIEPLKSLFKDEVRRVGKELNIKTELLGRHPFPGPGLAIRILGDITAQKVKMLQKADAIFINGLKKWNYYNKVWQAGAILLPINSVGKSGDKRTYEKVVALRAVQSNDGMSADCVALPHKLLSEISNQIIDQVEGINRVVYDISSKPPATIEWE